MPDRIDKLRRAHVRASKSTRKGAGSVFEKALAKIRRKHGDDIFTSFTGVVGPIECVSTGFPHLDDLLTGEADKGVTVVGTGMGMPRGRLIELWGPPGVGKTSLVLHMVKAFQQAGERAAVIDAEHAMDFKYMVDIGVNLEKLLFTQPSSAEEGLDVVEELIEDKLASVIIVDSVAALTPEAELEGDMGDAHMALQARLMSKAMRKLKVIAAKANVTLIFVNQTRQKIGGFHRPGMPPQETTSGGNALKFWADIRLEMKVIRLVRKGVKSLGAMTKIRCVKNKVAPPFRDAFMELSFGHGVIAVHPSDNADVDVEKES